jgi:hypothetical protein
MITVRTIGYQENAPKIRSIGKRKKSVERPPCLTHVTGLRRAWRRGDGACVLLIGACCAFSAVDATGSIVDIEPPRVVGSNGGVVLVVSTTPPPSFRLRA